MPWRSHCERTTRSLTVSRFRFSGLVSQAHTNAMKAVRTVRAASFQYGSDLLAGLKNQQIRKYTALVEEIIRLGIDEIQWVDPVRPRPANPEGIKPDDAMPEFPPPMLGGDT